MIEEVQVNVKEVHVFNYQVQDREKERASRGAWSGSGVRGRSRIFARMVNFCRRMVKLSFTC
jgi:hypothetical protein